VQIKSRDVIFSVVTDVVKSISIQRIVRRKEINLRSCTGRRRRDPRAARFEVEHQIDGVQGARADAAVEDEALRASNASAPLR